MIQKQQQQVRSDIISIDSVPVAISGAGVGKRSGREERTDQDMPAPDSGIAGRANPPSAAQQPKPAAADANFTPI